MTDDRRALSVDDVPGYVTEDLRLLYREAVARAPADRRSCFVEVGVALGRSSFYMADLVRRSGKPILFYAVDKLDWLHEGRFKYAREAGGGPEILKLVEEYRHRPMEELLDEIRTRLKFDSEILICPVFAQEVVGSFEDGSVDFLYVDASHEREDTAQILRAFLPKMAVGGVVAGHDLDHPDYPGVRQAVEEVFGGDFRKVGHSFVHEMGKKLR